MTDQFAVLKTGLADRYAIERELGAGGMATVYLAEEVKHRRQVAIKVMRPELAAAIGSERFLREITLTSQLQHPHILMLIDSGEIDGMLYYVMPYVAGESLADRMLRERQLPIEEAVKLTREVASALSYAHSRGIVHRDIKPDNILLSHGHAVVMDFGIGRALYEAGGEQLTSTGMAIGTPAYMSPEQASGESDVDGRTDIYALGCALYEMLAGEPPYTGRTPHAIIAKRLTDPVPSARRLRETISPHLDSVIRKALAKIPADRFATAHEFAEALAQPGAAVDDGITDAPVTPAAAPSTTPGGKWRGRLLGATVTAALAVAVTLGLLKIKAPADAVSTPNRISIAVLPFENLGVADDDFFADGITEEISTHLAGVSGLAVTARTSTLRYKGTTKRAAEIGAELGVEYLLTGTVRWSPASDGSRRVLVAPQLVKAADETRVWGEPYNEPLTETFALQANLAQRVARALNVTLLAGEVEAINRRPTENPAAYQEYMLAQFHFVRHDSVLAIEHYQKAIDLDPDFALAYAGLADAYHFLVATAAGGMLPAKMENWARAEQAARRALVLDSSLGAAHVSLAYVLVARDLNWQGAEAGFKRGIALNPNYATGHSRYAWLLMATGRLDSAVAEAERALALDPLSPLILTGLAQIYLAGGRVEEALELERRALVLNPEYRSAYGIMALAKLQIGEYEASAPDAEAYGLPADVTRLMVAALRDHPNQNPPLLAYFDRATRFVELAPIPVSVILTIIGEHDRALRVIEQGVADRAWGLIMWLKLSPLFDPLRDDPRFQGLLRRMGL